MRGRTPVLVLAREPIVAALVGMLLESERFEPVFPDADEPVDDALARTRAPILVMVDGECDSARSDLFFTRVARTSSRVVLFSAPSGRQGPASGDGAAIDVAALARDRGVPHVALPTDHATLQGVLAEAAGALPG